MCFFKAFFSSALNFFNNKSRCSLQPLPLRHTRLSVVEKMTDKFDAMISQSSGLLGLSATTSLHKATSCSGFGQRNGAIFAGTKSNTNRKINAIYLKRDVRAVEIQLNP